MRMVPAWICHYPRHLLATDVLAGMTVAVLVIPQSLAYALLAGLPAQSGLIVSIVPVLVYAWMGSSYTQAVGPVAITAIMTSAVLAPLAVAGTANYATLAALLALMSGTLMWAFGALRLGFLAQLLSRPVIAGFISGSAVLIILSQLRALLGVSADVEHSFLAWPTAMNPATAAIGLSAMLALVIARQWLVPALARLGLRPSTAARVARLAPLAVLFAATAWVVGTEADRSGGVAVVGAVNLGGALWIPFWPQWDQVLQLMGPALTLAFIGAVQGITMAQALAVKRRESLDVNQELTGLGAANVVAAYSGGMPVGGGTSRTAINTAAGAHTPLASVVTAFTMALVLLLGTAWMERLPIAALSASIVVAAMGMVDFTALRQAWRYDRADAAAYLGTAAGVWVLGLELGIALGIGLSLATLLFRASTPHIAVIGRVQGTEHFRNVERHTVETIDGAILLRVDESLFFGNLHAVQARLYGEIDRAGGTRDVVLLMSAVNRIDTTAMEVLADWNHDLATKGIRLHLAEVKGPVQDRLERVPLWRELSGRVFLSVNEAFETLRDRGLESCYEKNSCKRNEYEGWEVI